MSEVIAKVKKLDGKFYIKERDGSLFELSVDSTILKGQLVVGDKNNISSNLLVVLLNGGENITLRGADKQLFDDSLTQKQFAYEDVTTKTDSIDVVTTQQLKDINNARDAQNIETAGIENETPTSEHNSAKFERINGAITDVNATLLDYSYEKNYIITTDRNATDERRVLLAESGNTNDVPTITVTHVNNFTEDAPANVIGSVVATYITYDADGNNVTVTLSDTTNYALDGAGNVTLTAAGLALVNSGAELPAFTLTPNDGTVNGTAAAVVPSVTAVNDTPVNIISVAQTTNEDTAKVITGLSISDIDAANGSMSVTLSVVHGTIAVIGGTATISGSGTESVTLTGTIAQINATLSATNAVIYSPTTNFSGTDTLTMTTNDNGNTGIGGALSDTDTVTITINAIADVPNVLVHITKSGVVGSSVFTENFDDGNYSGWTTQTLLKNSFAEITGGTKGTSEATLFNNVAWSGQTSTSQFSSRWSIVNPSANTYSDDDNTRDLVYNNSDAGDDAQGMLAYSGLSATQKAYTNYTLSVDLFADTAGPEVNGIGFVFGYQNTDNYFLVRWENPGSRYNPVTGDLYTSYPGEQNRLVLVEMKNGLPTTLASTIFNADDWFNLKLSVNNAGISVSAVDVSSSATSTLSYAYGTVDGGVTSAPALNTIGLYIFDDDQDVRFDNIQINQGSYQYTLHTAAYLSDVDGSETLSNITLTNIPSYAVLWDSTTNTAVSLNSGTASVIAGHDIIISSVNLLTDTQLNNIQASVTATDTGGSVATDTDTAKIDVLGTASGETITGTTNNEWIDGKGGSDNLNSGDGNDILVFDSADTSINGGVGYDTLLVTQDIDFRNIDSLSNIEKIDLGSGVQNITINIAEVIQMTDSDNLLRIDGDSSDVVNISGTELTKTSTTTDGGVTYDIWSGTSGSESVTLQIEQDIHVNKI